MMRFSKGLIFSFVFLLSGCSYLPALIATPPPSQTPTHTQITVPTETWLAPTLSPSPTGPVRIRLWLPPFLNPDNDEPASDLLQKRLAEFQSSNPNLTIETRVKALSGPGGILDSLASASAAAPASLPDIVALPRDLLEAAALKGLLIPLDGLTTSLNDNDWYPYAGELARLQNNIYGFPFAGDALVQVYFTEAITTPLISWSSVLDSTKPIYFPAGSDSWLITLDQYQAGGGRVSDAQGRPILDEAKLTEVLTFYENAVQAGLIPIDQQVALQNDDQIWNAFLERRDGLTMTWASNYLSEVPEGTAIATIPTPNGEPFALANGWVWALVGRDENKRQLAVELAEFLTDSHFLADWSQAAGFLPTRKSSLSLWSNEDLQRSVDRILTAAHLFPSTDVLSSLEAPLQQATLSVLRGQVDPATAAQLAASSLTSP
jgi:multiple sugar transport system substrate-binding protein